MLRLLILSLVFMRNCSNNYYLIFLNEKASNCEKKTIGIEFELFLNLIMLTLKWCVEVDVCVRHWKNQVTINSILTRHNQICMFLAMVAFFANHKLNKIHKSDFQMNVLVNR